MNTLSCDCFKKFSHTFVDKTQWWLEPGIFSTMLKTNWFDTFLHTTIEHTVFISSLAFGTFTLHALLGNFLSIQEEYSQLQALPAHARRAKARLIISITSTLIASLLLLSAVVLGIVANHDSTVSTWTQATAITPLLFLCVLAIQCLKSASATLRHSYYYFTTASTNQESTNYRKHQMLYHTLQTVHAIDSFLAIGVMFHVFSCGVGGPALAGVAIVTVLACKLYAKVYEGTLGQSLQENMEKQTPPRLG